MSHQRWLCSSADGRMSFSTHRVRDLRYFRQVQFGGSDAGADKGWPGIGRAKSKFSRRSFPATTMWRFDAGIEFADRRNWSWSNAAARRWRFDAQERIGRVPDWRQMRARHGSDMRPRRANRVCVDRNWQKDELIIGLFFNRESKPAADIVLREIVAELAGLRLTKSADADFDSSDRSSAGARV